jgi:hypothetical protein
LAHFLSFYGYLLAYSSLFYHFMGSPAGFFDDFAKKGIKNPSTRQTRGCHLAGKALCS